MCASPCYYSGNSSLMNIQTSTPPFTDTLCPCLCEETSNTENTFGSLTVFVSVCNILCAGVNMDPMGQALEEKVPSKKITSGNVCPLST